MHRTKKRLFTHAERENYLREGLGLKKVVRDGRIHWVRDESKEQKLQYGAPIS